MASIHQPIEASQTRAGVEGAVRAELDALGDRLASFRDAADSEMERLAAFRWLAEQAGLGPSEVADRAGVSRQTLNNLRSRERGTDYRWPVDLRVMLRLGLGGPVSTDELVETIGLPPVRDSQVSAAIDRLVAEELIVEASRAAAVTNTPVVNWRLSARGLEDLPRRLRHAAMPPSRQWTAYITSSSAEAAAIADAGERALGEHGTVVIPAGTVRGMTRPEVAFYVEAPDPQTAQTAAITLFAVLRERAGMTPRSDPIVVAALLPPRRPAD